jgi:hypothetical protein
MLPRNTRCKAPRPLSVRHRAGQPPCAPRLDLTRSSPELARSNRTALGKVSERQPRHHARASRAHDSTPTPAPVVVAARPPREPEPRPIKSSRLAAALSLCVLALAVGGSAAGWRTLSKKGLLPWSSLDLSAAHATHTALTTTAEPPPSPPGWNVTHDGHVPVSGGVVVLPQSFVAKADGSYDLVVHFHGDRFVVEESVAHAGIDAALAVVNLGAAAALYRDAYRVQGAFEGLLEQIDGALRQRGVASPRLGRLALVAWGEGCSAIASVLEHRKSPAADADPLDAIVALDGIHGAFIDLDSRRLDARSVEPFTRAARVAAQGDLFMSLTHSQVEPKDLGGARRSQLFILDQLERPATRATALAQPAFLSLPASKNVVAAGKERRLSRMLDARSGNLRVQGFEGVTAEHHAAHLTQMAAIVLPDLKARWSKPRHPAPSDDEPTP